MERKTKIFNSKSKSEKQSKDVQLIYGRANIEEINFDEVKEKEPKFVFPNYQDYGYGIFLLDEKSRAYVLANIQNEKDDFLRTMMWGSLWDSVREAELAPKDYVALVIKSINVEPDESTIQTLLGRVATAMNYYLSDKQREEFTPQLETLLIDKMRNALTVGQRITFFRAFLNVASSDNARAVLKDVLSGKVAIKDLQLKSKDKFDIATRLTILNDKDAAQILAALEKSEASDEAKRYAYATRAGIGTTENAAKFWNDFTNNKDIFFGSYSFEKSFRFRFGVTGVDCYEFHSFIAFVSICISDIVKGTSVSRCKNFMCRKHFLKFFALFFRIISLLTAPTVLKSALMPEKSRPPKLS